LELGHWQAYIIAIVVGLLVGIEREKAHPNKKAMGVRTFLLISLLGAIAGGLQSPWIAALLTVFCLGLILISYFTEASSKTVGVDRGLTTEFAAAIVFCLGFSAHQSPALSAMIGPVVAMILFSKNTLHRLSHAIEPSELETALLLLLGGVVVINLVPDVVIDPWGIFNPKKFGYLILTLATVEFSSYVLTKIIGEKKGFLVVGFLGGLVSSTAVLLSSCRQANKTPLNWRTLVCSSLAAKLAALVELLLIVGLISPGLLLRVVLAVGAGLLFGGLALIIIAWKNEKRGFNLTLKSPLDWRGVWRLSFIFGAILALISLAKLWLGEEATFVVSFLTGLVELHGVSLASATMYSQGQLSVEVASLSILLAVIASLVAKIAISWVVSQTVFARAMTAVLLPMIIVIGLVAWLTIVFPGINFK
jgi:uncharacterized membrane protein (DUF4010 family)